VDKPCFAPFGVWLKTCGILYSCGFGRRAPVELSVHVSMRLSSKASTVIDGAMRSVLLHLSHGWLVHDPRPVLSSMTTVRQALEASSQCRAKPVTALILHVHERCHQVFSRGAGMQGRWQGRWRALGIGRVGRLPMRNGSQPGHAS